MEVGILTYHRTLNHGACLQAVATRLLLERLGHKVYYVDYWPKYHADSYKLFSFERFLKLSFRKKLGYLKSLLSYINYTKRRSAFHAFHSRYIIPYCAEINYTYDVVVYGSDQIWREQKALGDYNPVYFGDKTLLAKKKIAFSASMGKLPVYEKKKNEIRRLVGNFDMIGVREEDLRDFLISLGLINVKLTLDPTLLLTKEEWMRVLNIEIKVNEKYVLVYSIGKSAFNMQDIKDYAQKKGCVIKILHSSAIIKDDDTNISAIGPDKFVELINNAECVFTSSFHGLAFSIIFEKEFYASFNKNPNRAKTLLSKLGLLNRYSEPNALITRQQPIEYIKVNQKLKEEQQGTFEFLHKI